MNLIDSHCHLDSEPFDADRDPFEIVGLAADAKYQDVRVPAPPIVYVYAPVSRGSVDFSLRTAGTPVAVAGDARRILTGVRKANAWLRLRMAGLNLDNLGRSNSPGRLIGPSQSFSSRPGITDPLPGPDSPATAGDGDSDTTTCSHEETMKTARDFCYSSSFSPCR